MIINAGRRNPAGFFCKRSVSKVGINNENFVVLYTSGALPPHDNNDR